MIDISVHVGTLGAVVLYFRKDVRLVLSGVLDVLRGRLATPAARLALLFALATVPVVLAGLALSLTGLDQAMRSIKVIGWAMLLFGIVLYWFDQRGPSHKTASDWTVCDAFILGLWQAVALIPGTSRSGITITGARALGYTRTDAARLSMLMSVPTIFASAALLWGEAAATADWQAVRDGAIAAALAFAAALLALALMMRLLRSVSYTPYVVYRIILGTILLWIAYT